MRKTALVTVLVAVVGLAGCTNPDGEVDLTPVPTTASPPWACAGVPLRGIQLASGEADFETEQTGSWAPGREIGCIAYTEDGEWIVQIDFRTNLDAPEDTALALVADYPGTVALDGGDTPGGGYAYPTEDGVATALWVSDQTRMRMDVDLMHVAGGDRDPVDDVGNLLVSMLPWAFGGEDVPN